MANLFWQGAISGTGHTSVAAYDFNVASNWKVARNNSAPNFWVTSLTAPGPGDLAVVGGVITARTPLLFGGYTGTMGVGGWGPNGTTGLAGLQSGTTFTSSLFGFVCNLTPTSYPFPWLGGGITGDIYNWLFSDAIKNNAGLTNPAAISSALDISRSQAGLKLKVQERSSFLTTGRIDSALASGATSGTAGYPNYSVVNIDFVQSRSQLTGITAGACTSKFVLGEATTAANDGIGTAIINGGGFNEVVVTRFNNSNGTSTGKAPSVTLNNVVVRSAVIPNCDFNVAADSTVGTLTVIEGYLPYYEKNKKDITIDNREITFLGKANTPLANAALGYINTASTSVTGGFVSGIYLNKQYAGVNDGHYDYIPTVVVGWPEGASGYFPPVAIENIQIAAAGASGAPSNLSALRRWNVLFNGNATVTTIANDGGIVSAYEGIRSDSIVTIGELQMRNNAVLDLTQASDFNGWYFGSLTGGTGTNPGNYFVIGGINFLDDSSIVVGSAGVRLYNTKVAAGYDFRAGTDAPASKFAVFTQDFGGKK
jgi:hypothetical protein